MPALISVFTHAAIPQKLLLLAFLAALPLIPIAAALGRRRLVADLSFAGPLLGLLTGAMNAFHMSETIRRVSFEPTAKQLGPGLAEISTLVGLGALVGLVAFLARRVLEPSVP
jgi:hypothetical protein